MTMLDSMRRHRGWLKWSLALVVVTFMLFFIPQDFLQPSQTTVGAAPREVIAEVDGRELTAGEFQQRYLTQVQQYRQQFGGSINDQLLRQLGVEQQVLAQMIDEEVALIEADRNGIRVSDEELAQQIFAIPALQENGRFIGEERYAQMLQAQLPPLTKSQFEESLRRSMVVDKLRGAVTDWMAISDAELEREFRRRNEKVKLQIVALTADAFRDTVTVTDADVAAWFDSHKAEYRVGERRTIRYLLLDRDLQRQKVTVPATDIQRFYNDNIQQYQTPEQIRASHILLNTAGKDEASVRTQAEALLAQVKAGADFAALATQHSEDEGSKANGGDLDYFGRGRMVPEFEDAAFTLAPGQVSDLVKSQFGFHIIKVVDKRAGSTRTLDEVRPQIQEQLAFQISDQQIIDQATKLEDRIEDAGDLAEAAAELGLTVQESGAFQREDPVPGLGAAPQVAAAAFQLENDEVSQAIASPRGPVFIAVAGKTDPYVPKLEEVTDRVRKDLIRSRATDASRQRAAEIAASLKGANAVTFAARAKQLGFEAKATTELVAREAALPDIGISPEVDKVAFGLPAGAVSDPIATGDGTVIARVDERDEVTADEFRQGREAFRAELLGERRNRFFTSYMNKAKARLTVEIKQDVLRRVTAAQNAS
jgi:peptidyl-prolyl cis-trans isomerase D